MTARILDGLKIRDQIFAELSDEVRLLTAAGVRPGLAAVLVGENPASQLYVKSKSQPANNSASPARSLRLLPRSALSTCSLSSKT